MRTRPNTNLQNAQMSKYGNTIKSERHNNSIQVAYS